MRYSDRLLMLNFETTDTGARVFYPHGPWGKGYIVPNPAREQEILKQAKRMKIFSYISPFVGSLLGEALLIYADYWWIPCILIFIVFAGITVWGLMYTKMMIAGLTPSTSPRPTLAEWYQKLAGIQNFWLLFFAELISVACIIKCLEILFLHDDPLYLQVIAAFCLILFGFTAYVLEYMIRVKLEE